MHAIKKSDLFNNRLHINEISSTTSCEKHDAKFGYPCYRILNKVTGKEHWGICNKRAIRAGRNGKVRAESLRNGKR